MLFTLEIKKIVKQNVFLFASCIMLLLLFWMAYAQYANGIIYEDIHGNQTPLYGIDFIDHDKQASSNFNGRAVDTDFLLEVQAYSWAFLEDASVERIAGTSLSAFYRKFDTDTVTVMGELDLNPQDVFGEALPVYYYTENWYRITSAVANITTVFLFFTVILSAQVFCQEYMSGAFLSVSPTKNGRHTLAYTKIAAALTVISVSFFITVLLTVLLFGSIFGFEHAGADIRVFANGAYFGMPAGVSCVVLLCVEILFCYCAVVCVCAASLFFSAWCQTVYAALIAAPLVLFLPNICQINRLPMRWTAILYNVWPSNFLYLPTSDWYRQALGLPMFAWIPVYLLIVCILLWGAAQLWTRHHI